MRFRKLRIAWSVVCGIACALLIVLWVRSFWWVSAFDANVAVRCHLIVLALPGGLGLSIEGSSELPPWRLLNRETTQWMSDQARSGRPYLNRIWGPTGFYKGTVLLPHWLLIPFAALLAAAPWLRWRFSLRILLIATTLIAVVLGLIVWLR